MVIDIMLFIALLSLMTLPIVLYILLIMINRIYKDWKKYINKL